MARTKRLLTYIASPTGRAFHNCLAKIKGIMGCVGSGKTVICIWDMVAKSMDQIPDPYDNVRRSKWLVVRNTYGMLLKTTIPTLLAWFPQTQMHMSAPLSGKLVLPHPSGDGTIVEILFEFLAIDSEDALRTLKSYEVTGVYVNEACELPLKWIMRAFEREGRYPKADDAQGIKYKSFGLIMDTNPPTDTSWWHELAEVRKPKGFAFFRQPPALLKRESKGRIWYEPNRGQDPAYPAAENINNHNDGWDYYLKQVVDEDHARINVFVLGNYGTTINGDPVYPDYNDRIHNSREDIPVNWGLPLWLGSDFGRTPCSVIGQVSMTGQLRIIDEICTTNCDVLKFAKQFLRPKLINEYRMGEMQVYNFGDPAGNNPTEVAEITSIQIMNAAGIPTVACPVPRNDFTLRRDSVAERFRSQCGGEPGIIIGPKAKVIRAGCASRYYYKKFTTADSGDERIALEPEKNMFSHPQDALQYLSYGVSHPSRGSLFNNTRSGGGGFMVSDGRTYDSKLDMSGHF